MIVEKLNFNFFTFLSKKCLDTFKCYQRDIQSVFFSFIKHKKDVSMKNTSFQYFLFSSLKNELIKPFNHIWISVVKK